jgi:hypothetical protein
MEKKFGVVEVNGITIYNTTPHPIRIIGKDGQVELEIPKATEPLRLCEDNNFWGQVGGIPLFRKSFFFTELPPPKPDTYYIVPLPVAQLVRRDDDDFIVPHDYVRDSEGNIIGCRAFAFVD